MIAFPLERTYLQAEPVRPPQSRQVESTNQSTALQAREEHNGAQAFTLREGEKRGLVQTEEPVPSDGKGALIDLLL